jgi:hypothetical protein
MWQATDTQATDTQAAATQATHVQIQRQLKIPRRRIIILLPPMALYFAFIDDDNNQRRLGQTLLIILLLQYHNNIQDRHYLLRSAIVQPQESPWRSQYSNADQTSFLHLTGLSRNAFAILLDSLFDLEDIAQRRRHGRPRLLYPDGYLFFIWGAR